MKAPNGDFYFIYSCDDAIRSLPFKDLECAQFARMRQVVIDTSSLRPVDESGKPASVFREPGKYSFYLGRNLETENTSETLNICTVKLRKKK